MANVRRLESKIVEQSKKFDSQMVSVKGKFKGLENKGDKQLRDLENIKESFSSKSDRNDINELKTSFMNKI